MDDFRILKAADSALVIEFGAAIDRGISDRVLALAETLDNAGLPGATEIVATFRSLCVNYDSLVTTGADLEAAIAELVKGSSASSQSPPVVGHSGLLRSVPRARYRGSRKARRLDRRRGRGVARRHAIPCLHDRLRSRISLYGRPAGKAAAAAAARSANAGAAGLARHRHQHDRGLPLRKSRRLASDRHLAGALLRSGIGRRVRCSSPAMP